MNTSLCKAHQGDRPTTPILLHTGNPPSGAEEPDDDYYPQDDLDVPIEPEFDETFQDIVEMQMYGDSDLGDCFHAQPHPSLHGADPEFSPASSTVDRLGLTHPPPWAQDIPGRPRR